MIGTTLSHFRIIAKLGEGGMGEVYRAEDTNLGREVAIKILPEEVASDREWLERFQREARAASALNHPHICTIHELGEHQGQPLLVMELLQGMTLRERLAAGRLSSAQVIEFALQIADALDAAHGKNIVHRDIKPANLFVTDRGDIKMLDFGLAKIRADLTESDSALPTALADRTLTRAGSTLGTVAYMSPEQARGEPLDARSDLFSLGVVLYEMATGRPPFDGATSAVVFSEILGKDPQPASRIDATVPPGLEAVIGRLLEKDVNLRYQSAADLRAELLRLRRDTGSAPAVSAPAVAPSSEPLRPARAPRWLLPVALAALIALGGLLAWKLLSRPGDTPDSAASSAPAMPQTSGRTTIAVLPLQNLGADASIDYLRLAVPDEITTTLSLVPNLTVRPFSSASSMAEGPLDLPALAEQLRVANLVTGQYYSEGEQLNLTLEAINVADDSVLWRGRIVASQADLLELRNRVAERVRQELLPKLGIALEETSQGTRPQSSEGYELYARSLAIPNVTGPNREAIALLERSIELDPTYAPAWAALNIRYYYDAIFAEGGPLMMEKAAAAAAEAIRLDPQQVEPHLYLLTRSADIGDLEEAFRRAQRLVESRPDSALSWFARSYIYRYGGLLDESAADCQRALELDPVNSRIRSCAVTYFNLGDAERARHFSQLDAGSDWYYDSMGHVLLLEGDVEGAIESFTSASETAVGYIEGRLLAACRSDAPDTESLAARYEAQCLEINDSEVDFEAASTLAFCGRTQQALRHFERAVDRNYCAFPTVDNDPNWKDLRSDPEFQRIRDKAIACRQRFAAFVEKKLAASASS